MKLLQLLWERKKRVEKDSDNQLLKDSKAEYRNQKSIEQSIDFFYCEETEEKFYLYCWIMVNNVLWFVYHSKRSFNNE